MRTLSTLAILIFAMVTLLVFYSSAQAAVILNVDGDGQLTGAQNVDVDGTLYDVEFTDKGSCITLFQGCDSSSDFVFAEDPSTALLAGQALLDQVLLDGVDGPFDTTTFLTFACDFFFNPSILNVSLCSLSICRQIHSTL